MLFLKRRLQFAAIEDSSSVRTFRTFLTSFLLTTERRPTSLGGVHRDHEGQVAVGHTQDQVLPLLAEEFLLPQLFDHCRAVLRMHYGVALTEHETPSEIERNGWLGATSQQDSTGAPRNATQNRRSEG